MSRKPAQRNTSLRLRKDVRAASMNSCPAYCNQERALCYADPNLPQGTCDDRYPVCQNACTVCGITR